ncbi:MAG: carbamate kinase [Deltaproteobacteria bacterium]|nr:carbamate kinase [Deltaproteobacteria bacterium]
MVETAGAIIVSIGGNAIIRRSDSGAIEEQFENVRSVCACIARMVRAGGSVIITHGNGPIVGNIMIRNEAVRDRIPPMPLYMCDADSEGGIGFMIQQTLHNEIHRAHKIQDVVTVVTQVVVDGADPAFKNPAKPIGPYYTEEEAERLAHRGWVMGRDAVKGYRRVVASPRPKRIVEAEAIRKICEAGIVVIAAGGGGVPVVEAEDGTLKGVDAVIDKDLATALLARQTGAGLIINLTQVDRVYLNYGAPGQTGLSELTVAQARGYLNEGQFPPGSMGPKIEAAMEFLEGGGKEVVITEPELIEDALAGEAGTRIVP